MSLGLLQRGLGVDKAGLELVLAVSTNWGSLLWRPYTKSPNIWGLHWAPDFWKLPPASAKLGGCCSSRALREFRMLWIHIGVACFKFLNLNSNPAKARSALRVSCPRALGTGCDRCLELDRSSHWWNLVAKASARCRTDLKKDQQRRTLIMEAACDTKPGGLP